MPWLEHRRSGWRVGWRTGGRGSRVEHSEPRESKALAPADLRAVEARLSALRPARGLVLQWDTLVARFIASRDGATTSRAAATTAAHRDQMRRCLLALREEHGWTTASDVRPADCLTLRPYHLRVLRAFLRYASLADQSAVDHDALAAQRHAEAQERDRQVVNGAGFCWFELDNVAGGDWGWVRLLLRQDGKRIYAGSPAKREGLAVVESWTELARAAQ